GQFDWSLTEAPRYCLQESVSQPIRKKDYGLDDEDSPDKGVKTANTVFAF
ncbi:hypothetical protein STEG23_030642, partial [Scotinomys teguina]